MIRTMDVENLKMIRMMTKVVLVVHQGSVETKQQIRMSQRYCTDGYSLFIAVL